MNLNFFIYLLISIQIANQEFRPNKKLSDSPDDVAYYAALHLQKIVESENKLAVTSSNVDRQSAKTRFISLYNIPVTGFRRNIKGEIEPYNQLDEMVKVLIFTVNQLNRINPPATLVKVRDDLFAISIDSPGWPTTAWDQLASKDAYFRREWINESSWNYLVYYTYTNYPIMRSDQFISISTIPPDYYNLLGLPVTKDELIKLLGIDEKLLADAYRIKAGVKTDGLTVTINNRILERRQGAFDIWSSNDVVNSKDKKNALRQLDVIGGDIHKLDIDGQEHVFELGWGGWGGFLNDAKGKRVDEVPIAIARDDNYRDYRVIAGRSCLTCHDLGIKSFSSDQATLLKNQVVQLRTINSQDAIALSARYDENFVQRMIKTDQDNYRASIENLVGVSPEKIASMYSSAWRTYNEQRVTLHQAAIESGLSDDGLIATIVPSIDPNLLKFLELDDNKQPRTISRDVFEDVFDDLMLLKGKVPARPIPMPGVGVRGVQSNVVPNPAPVSTPKIAEDPEIIGQIVFKKPAAIGEVQSLKVTLKSPNKFFVKNYIDTSNNISVNVYSVPSNSHELNITFTNNNQNQNGLPSELEIVLDSGKHVRIPITFVK
jgi:hypothetical protein